MNIFIAKLSSDTVSKDLSELFSQFGEVASAKVIMDRETGHSKKYGFVEMKDANEAQTAIEHLNGTELKGSTIIVKESLPQSEGKGKKDNKKRFFNKK